MAKLIAVIIVMAFFSVPIFVTEAYGFLPGWLTMVVMAFLPVVLKD